jgi:hypothetical protein
MKDARKGGYMPKENPFVTSNPSIRGLMDSSESQNDTAVDANQSEDVEQSEGGFWDEDETQGSESESSSSEQTSENAEGEDDSQSQASVSTHTYKANGQEYEVDFGSEEGIQKAIKALEMVEGARKAWSDRAKLQKKLKDIESSSAEQGKIVSMWNQMRGLVESGDTATLYKVITGEDLETMIERESKRSELKKQAQNNPDLMRNLERDDELDKIRRSHAKLEYESKQRTAKLEEQEVQQEFQNFQDMYTPVFMEHVAQFDGLEESSKNKLYKMLWKSSLDELKELDEQGFDVRKPSTYRKVFESNAKALMIYNVKGSQAKADKIIEDKKKVAKNEAQLASSNKYPGGSGKKSGGFNSMVDYVRSLNKK